MISIEYLAGMIDADGCIQIHAAGPKKYNCRYPRLGVTNTDKKLMEDLVEGFGGTFRIKPDNGKGKLKRTMPCYDWRLDGDTCRNLLAKLLPYLRVKQGRAYDVLLGDSKKSLDDIKGIFLGA